MDLQVWDGAVIGDFGDARSVLRRQRCVSTTPSHVYVRSVRYELKDWIARRCRDLQKFDEPFFCLRKPSEKDENSSSKADDPMLDIKSELFFVAFFDLRS